MMAASIPPKTVAPMWRRLVSGNVAVVAIRLVSVMTGLAYVKVYSGALSATEVGTFFYLSTLSYALNALIFVPVDFYTQARIARLDGLPVDGLLRLVVRVLAVGLLACIALSAALIWLNKLNFGDLPLLFAVASLLYLCTSARGILNNRGNTVFVSSMLLLESGGRLGAFVGMAALFGASARMLMASTVIALGVELAIILAQGLGRIARSDERGDLDTPRAIFNTAAPIAGSAVCNVLQLQTYRVAYPLAGLEVTSGIYGVVSNIGAAAMSACGSIFSQVQVPRLYQTQGDSIRSFVALAALMTAAMLIVALAYGPFLVRLLTKPEYVPYALAIGFGVFTEACNLIVGGYTVLLSIGGRTGTLLKFNAAATLFSMGGCVTAMHFRPNDPFLIGFVVAGSQLLMTSSLVIFATSHQTVIAK